MCGISGFIDYTKNSSKDELVAMTDSLIHRGPDSSGYRFIEEKSYSIGIGHRRLSIIDLSEGGSQPKKYHDIEITFNGEIYNFKEIKVELEKLNHSFETNSDTEVILHAYEQWGIACIDRFIGMFAFVIFDCKKQKLFCVRDRAGIKPFFYYWNKGLFMFASELKAFHMHHAFEKKISYSAISAFMQYGHIPTPHCIFQNCFKLNPGHYLEFDIDKQSINTKQYWNVYDYYNKDKLKISFEEAKIETEKILQSAANYRMVSDVPIGVFLSGGYDSTSLTALLQKESSEKIKTFTIAVTDMGLNEAPFAKEIAKHLGTDHHEYECSSKEALELLAQLPYYYDEPFGDQSAIPTTLVCKMAKKQVTVALSADAGDEVFAGYNRYYYMQKHGNLINSIPKVLRKSSASLMNKLPADNIPYFKNKYNFHNRYEKLKSLLKDPSPKNMMMSMSQQFDSVEIQSLLLEPIQALNTMYNSDELLDKNFSTLSYMMAIDYQTYLLDDILQKVDRASMSVSLEAREPYLDHRLIEWAAQLPNEYKYYKGEKKFILKEITHKYIPKTLMDRPKMGFAIPLEKWLVVDLKDKILHYLDASRIEKQQIFNPKAVQKIVNQFYSGRKELALKIWYLFMFQLWHEKWME